MGGRDMEDNPGRPFVLVPWHVPSPDSKTRLSLYGNNYIFAQEGCCPLGVPPAPRAALEQLQTRVIHAISRVLRTGAIDRLDCAVGVDFIACFVSGFLRENEIRTR